MKAFISGICAMAVIGVAAWYVLTRQLDYSSMAVYTTGHDAVRLDPGMGQRPGEHM
ncbi:hypothetical protein [Roseibium aggregatum]|uniref:Uncharacterized protein n=1 Tax=Roseibium aggregatum TaxID=187304 RepID=A0A926P3Q9_9HYPH|nr:hypothetical protein [Roseibium aggregatum]MBD1546701.1 hypothetical protein [Roseibium aggregatum]